MFQVLLPGIVFQVDGYIAIRLWKVQLVYPMNKAFEASDKLNLCVSLSHDGFEMLSVLNTRP